MVETFWIIVAIFIATIFAGGVTHAPDIVLALPLGLFLIWGIVWIVRQYKRDRLKYDRNILIGRPVKISHKWLKEHYPDLRGKRIGEITEVSPTGKYQVSILATAKETAKQEVQYKKDYQQNLKSYEALMSQWEANQKTRREQGQQAAEALNPYYPGYYGMNGLPQEYYNQPPTKPQYNFSPEDNFYGMVIEKKYTKLMPAKYTVINGMVAIKLKTKEPTQRGGEKEVKKMPRLFRYAIYLAGVVLVWDFVVNANNVVSFVVHTFILQH